VAKDLILGTRKTDWSRGATVGSDDPLVWTPSAVRAELARVLDLLDTVNLEAGQALKDEKISDDEWKLWEQKYKLIHNFLTSASGLWGSNAMEARQKEQEILKWHDLIISRGGKPVGPRNPGRNQESPFNTTTLALLIGGVAASAFLISAIKK
jgi:hypothetical protein